MTRDDEGFSLIELLVVMIILGILAAIAIPTYLSQRENGYIASVTTDLRQVLVALESVALENGGSYSSLDAATQTTTALLDSGYEGAATTQVVIAASTNAYCVEGRDSRSPGRLVVVRSTAPGAVVDDPGCP